MDTSANTDVAIGETAFHHDTRMRKVQRLSRFASGCCTGLTIFFAIVALVTFAFILFGPTESMMGKIDMGGWRVRGDQINTWQIKLILVVFIAPMFAVILFVMNHLDRLFDNFVNGAIYTKENVRHVLLVGRIWLYAGIVGPFIPLLSAIPLSLGIIESSSVELRDIKIGLGAFVAWFPGALIILLAWIMDVGRQTQDEATQLRQEAELTV